MTEEQQPDPEIIEVRGIDVIPYEYGLWCSIGSGEPFVNEIVGRRWTDDGQRISAMLESHNFTSFVPDEMVRVVRMPADSWRPKCRKLTDSNNLNAEAYSRACQCAECFPASRPNPLPEEPVLIAALNELPADARCRVLDQVKR